MNVVVAHLSHATRERLCIALRARGLQVFSVPDVAGLLSSVTQAKLTLALVDPRLLRKAPQDLRAQMQARGGNPVQLVALSNRIGEDGDVFERHGATMLEHPVEATADVAAWALDFVERLSTGGRSANTGGHWTRNPLDLDARGVVLGADGPGPVILVVEDEPTFRMFLCDALGDQGYKVYAAPSGEDALEFFRTHDANLVISDINMPGMDGFELKQKIDLWRKAPTPFLMMTADSNAENAGNAAAVGVVFIIGKPIRNLDALFAIVKEAMKKGGVDYDPDARG